MTMDDLVFLDTETTGLGPDDRLCQVAYHYQGVEYQELFRPPVPISVEAMAVSHITNAMVQDKSTFEGSAMQAHLKQLLEDENQMLVAHNAQFDISMLAKDQVSTKRYIDTVKIACHLDSEGVIPRYGLQYLRYFLNLGLSPQEAPAHDALGDVRVLVKLFERLYEKMSQGLTGQEIKKEMMRISQLPRLMKKFDFGKYKDRLVAEVAQQDRGYLEWLQKEKIKQREEGHPDEDWEYTLTTHLG